MIIKKTKFRENGVTKIIRICDECQAKKKIRLGTVQRGRKKRGKDIDLCASCANSRKYKKYNRGKDHHSWKHGLQGGYQRITLKDGRRIGIQRYVYEQDIGRKLVKGETVHHIDLDKLNNKIENLILFKNHSDHKQCHTKSMEKCALLFLNFNTWFDFQNNKYTLKYDKFSCQRDEIKIDLSIFGKKIGIKFPMYKRLQNDGSFKKRRCHTVIGEYILGRRLYQGEVVHHIDGDYLNNNPNNLIVLERKSHIEAHYYLQLCAAQLLKIGLVEFDREKKEYFRKI